MVILPTLQYESKIQNFIDNNNFTKITYDPTNIFQNQIRKTVKDIISLIPKDSKWRYINMNPTASTIKGLIKLHKTDQPIRPVVNWRSAPAYKIAKMFTEKIHRLTPLPNAFNIRNTQHFLQNIKDIPLKPHHCLASLDITNLYSNIPITETKTILRNIMEHEQITPQTQQELMTCYEVITKQNYFANNTEIIVQQDGLAMGAPSLGLIAEIFLQHLEHTHLPHIARKHKIVDYSRYVDDIFLIFDTTHTNI